MSTGRLRSHAPWIGPAVRAVPAMLAVLAMLAMLITGCSAPEAAPASPSAAVTSDTSTPSVRPSTPAVLANAATPCISAPAPLQYTHVIWIVMENKAETSVVGSREAPFLSDLASRCGHASSYYAISHPSLPNYVALTSGSTHGIHDDGGPLVHPVSGPSVFSEVSAGGGTWATYAESMPSACAPSSSGEYATKHNPAVYYTALAGGCPSRDVPLGTLSAGPLHTVLETGQLPTFSLIVPNLCDDTHDCPVLHGDQWLSQWLTAIMDSSSYAGGQTAIFVTWDEDDSAHRNQVGLVAVAPSIRAGTEVTSSFTHLSLLRTTEDLLGLHGTLVPDARSMRAAFGL